jgi:hypothetical protein
VLLNFHREEAPKNAIKQKKNRGKTDIEIFVGFLGKSFQKVFDIDMDFLYTHFCRVLELFYKKIVSKKFYKKIDTDCTAPWNCVSPPDLAPPWQGCTAVGGANL